MPKSLFNKVAGLRRSRIAYFREHLRWLLLQYCCNAWAGAPNYCFDMTHCRPIRVYGNEGPILAAFSNPWLVIEMWQDTLAWKMFIRTGWILFFSFYSLE